MADDGPLTQEALLQLRQLMAQLQGDDGASLPLEEAISLAEALQERQGVTIDVAASKTLGQPLVVVRLPQPSTAQQAPDPRLALLSPREREVAECVAQGMRNKEIANTLHIALSTVKDHVHNILARLDLPGRTALAALILKDKG